MPEVFTNSLKSTQSEAMKISGCNDNFFVAGDAFPVSSNALTEHKNSNCKLAGVKQIRLHDFRHSCASLLINKGANVQVVSKYLGHTKIEEIYHQFTTGESTYKRLNSEKFITNFRMISQECQRHLLYS